MTLNIREADSQCKEREREREREVNGKPTAPSQTAKIVAFVFLIF